MRDHLDDNPDLNENRLSLKILEPGQQVDQFRLVREIGQGGMSEVFLARDIKLGRKVALKVIRAEYAKSPQRLELLLREARLTAKFAHPHIITIYSVGEFEGCPYLALEYLEGRTLSQRIREGPISALEAARIGLAIALALDEAHSHGVLHRDLKPSNVIIPLDGRIRVLDFGLSKMVEESILPPQSMQDSFTEYNEDDIRHDLSLTKTMSRDSERYNEETATQKTGSIEGTPPYIAPERWLRKPYTGAADLWALGVILFKMLTKVHPFLSGERSIPTLVNVILSAKKPLELLQNMDVPAELSRLIHAMLEPDPSSRPPCQKVVEVLQGLLQRKPVQSFGRISPFRGFLPFSESHSHFFFGRNSEIEIAVERLRNEPILPVVGPSGAGKSSFVAAGIVPRLRELDRWLVLSVRPGTNPFETLGSILQAGWSGDTKFTISPPNSVVPNSQNEDEELQPTKTMSLALISDATNPSSNNLQCSSDTSLQTLTQDLRQWPEKLLLELQALAEKTLSNVLLFVDQLEELYTHEHETDLRRSYMEAITRAADDPEGPIRVIFTLRDDFLGRVAETASAREALSPIMVLRAPGAEALYETVTKPVELAEYSYEDKELPEEMIEAVRAAPASLPLLQFTCSQLWNRRNEEKKLLTRAAYDEIGGVEGALASKADELLVGLSEVQRNVAKQLLLRLVTTEGTRRVVRKQELLDGLDSSAQLVLSRLTEARMVVSRRSKGTNSAEAELELVHDSLIQSWKPLVHWLEQSREEVVFLDEVSRAAELWNSRGRKSNEVWSGEALDEARVKIKRCEAVPNQVREFLEAGELHHQSRARGRRKIIFAGFLTLLSVIAVLLYMNQQTETQREIAVTERERQQQAYANSLREGARAASIKGDFLEARSKIRSSLEVRDSTQARALWWLLDNIPLVWSKNIDSFVFGVSVSPNGRLIATSNESIHIVDTKTLEHHILSGHKSLVYALDFSPNGRYLSSGSTDGEIRVWDLKGGTFKVLKGHTSRVLSTVFFPDGKRLASGSYDKTIKIWDIESAVLLRTLENDYSVLTVHLYPNGRFIISTNASGKIFFWNAHSFELEHVLEEPGIKIEKASISADGKLLASTCKDGAIIVWDLETLQKRARLIGDTAHIESVSFNSNNLNYLAASTYDGRVLVWDTMTWSLRHEFHHVKAPAFGVSFLPEGKQLVSTGQDGTLKLWKLNTHFSQIKGAGHSSPIFGLAFSPDGKTIATGGSLDGELRFWRVTSSQSIRRIRGHDAPLYDITFNHNGKLLAAGSQDGSIRLYTYPLGQLRKTLYGHRDSVMSVAFSLDGTLLLSGSNDTNIAFWDLDSLTLRKSLSTGKSVYSIDIAPDGRLLASASPDSVQLRDIETGQIRKSFSGHTDTIFSIAFSPNSKSLYSSSYDNTVRRYSLVNTSTDAEVVARHQGIITFIDVTHTTEDILGTPSADGTAKIWYIDTDEVFTLRGHRDEVNRLKFSPDGTRVATVSDDSTLRLWDTKTGRPLWRAPLMLEEPPTLLTENGWVRFEDESSPSPPTTKWQKAAQARAKLASALGNRETLCLITFGDDLEIWNIPDDELTFKAKLSGTQQVISIRSGCLTRSQDSVTFTRTTGKAITMAQQAEAMSRSEDSIFVLQGDTVHILDLEGNQQDEFQATAGANALTLVENALALGFPTGRIEIWRRDGENSRKEFTCQEPENAPVTTLIPGPPGTIIAGFENGVLGIWSIDTGERLFSHQLHGPVIHLLLPNHKLYAATELGSRVQFDLSMFYIDYCDLMDRVWREVFWVWEDGRARYREVPTDHECSARR